MKIITDSTFENRPLKSGKLDLWFSPLEWPSEKINDFEALLSSEEKERAKRFQLENVRNHFIAARAILRILLGQYLNQPADQICFSYGEWGKPELTPQSNLTFNLSHSGGFALYGIGINQKLGIDMEDYSQKPNRPLDELAKRFFAKEEYQAIKNATPENKTDVFFPIWTKKEALLKAVGVGLYESLDQFVVSEQLDQVETLENLSFDPNKDKWRLLSMEHKNQLSISIASNAPLNEINFRNYSSSR